MDQAKRMVEILSETQLTFIEEEFGLDKEAILAMSNDEVYENGRSTSE